MTKFTVTLSLACLVVVSLTAPAVTQEKPATIERAKELALAEMHVATNQAFVQMAEAALRNVEIQVMVLEWKLIASLLSAAAERNAPIQCGLFVAAIKDERAAKLRSNAQANRAALDVQWRLSLTNLARSQLRLKGLQERAKSNK